jgi:hypothetical protein
MSRCCICDYCTETEGSDGRSFRWSDKEVGYVCSVCQQGIYEISQTRKEIENGERILPIIDDYWDKDVEPTSFLELGGLAEGPSEDTT